MIIRIHSQDWDKLLEELRDTFDDNIFKGRRRIRMAWNPNKEQTKIMRTIAGMTIDCLMGKGTENEETYTSNLHFMANMVDKEEKLNPEKGGKDG